MRSDSITLLTLMGPCKTFSGTEHRSGRYLCFLSTLIQPYHPYFPSCSPLTPSSAPPPTPNHYDHYCHHQLQHFGPLHHDQPQQNHNHYLHFYYLQSLRLLHLHSLLFQRWKTLCFICGWWTLQLTQHNLLLSTRTHTRTYVLLTFPPQIDFIFFFF